MKYPINHLWYFKPHYQSGDEHLSLSEVTTFESIRLPHTMTETPYHYFDENCYQHQAIYYRQLTLTHIDNTQSLFIIFEGVMVSAKVYLDGKLLATHQGGYTTFEVDLSPELQQGKSDYLLAVVVNASEDQNIPPFGFVIDYLTYGGIYREVNLETRPKTFISNMQIITQVENKPIGIHHGSATLETTLFFNQDFEGQLHLLITSPHETILDKTLKIASKKGAYSFKEELTDVAYWSTTSPILHDIKATIQNDTSTYDYQTRFGFREVSFKTDGFYLNHHPMKIRGLNRHQSFPYVGYAMPKNAQRKDADLLKEMLGVNLVRCSHYPQSKHFLDRCDEIGLLVFEEIPGWQYVGDAEWGERVKADVEDMIKMQWHHPSIVIWGVRINESQDQHDLYQATNQIAHDLDPSRPTGGVRNFAGSEVFEDVYTYNDFIHRGNNIALDKPQKIAKKEMPYLVTEHNGHMHPTKKFDPEIKRLEQAKRHLNVLEAAYADPHISGAIGWCMFDYNTHKDFGSGDKICYHGVMDMFRLPKHAAFAYGSQSDSKPVMHVASSMQVGEFDASELGDIYLFTNCDWVEVYKNGQKLTTAYPDNELYSHLPSPPIIIKDLIGDLIKDNESFSEKDADRVKKALLMFQKVGSNLPLKTKITLGYLMLKYRLKYEDAVKLYEKYVANWGKSSTVYEFKGYKDKQCVAEKTLTADIKPVLNLSADANELFEEETYDVTRLVVSLDDQYGNPLTFAFSPIDITVEGPIEIIGPSHVNLIGGSIGFWVKTTGETGKAEVKVVCETYGYEKVIPLQVK